MGLDSGNFDEIDDLIDELPNEPAVPAAVPEPASASADAAQTGDGEAAGTDAADPARGQRRQPGRAQAVVNVQLQPIRYQISLYYLGDQRVEHDANYQCRYELTDSIMLPFEGAPHLIRNMVQVTPPGPNQPPPHEPSATPFADGGDNSNPRGDREFRIVIRDNHALRRADIDMLGRPDGDRVSRPQSYQQRNWIRDVRPAVPFRVVVKQFIGDQQVHLSRTMRVVVEVKDPAEEIQRQPTGVTRDFLADFFGRNNRTDTNPTPGDDNASTAYRGVRPTDGANPGARAADVLRRAPYLAPPITDAAPAAGRLRFSQLGAPAVRNSSQGLFPITTVRDRGFDVGVSDYVHFPWPAGGDNYRFLIWLVDDGGQDVRASLQNGHPVELLDHARRPIPRPLAYTTGRFIVWKRLRIRAVILTQDLGRDAATGALGATEVGQLLDWDSIANKYKASFIDIEKPRFPDDYFSLPQANWRREMARELTGNPNGFAGNAAFNNYTGQFFPAGINAGPDADAQLGHLENVVFRIVEHSCPNLAQPIPTNQSPTRDRNQNRDHGVFIVMTRNVTPAVDGLAVGAYFGDRTFWMRARAGNTPLATSTCAHEMGHAMYLRHGHVTRNRNIPYHRPGHATPLRILLVNGSHDDDFLEDHAQDNAIDCLMSYTRSLQSAPCAICSLTLRFYDRLAIQRNRPNRRQILHGLNPITIVQATRPAAPPVNPPRWELNETIPAIRVGQAIELMAVSPQEIQINRSENLDFVRINLTRASRSRWTQVSGPGQVAMFLRDETIRIRGTRPGSVTLRFAIEESDVTQDMIINVAAPVAAAGGAAHAPAHAAP